MKKFLSLYRKKSRIVIGILSGTSVDAVDLVLVKINGSGKSTSVKVIDSESYMINKKLKDFILKVSSNKEIKTEVICSLNFMLGNLFAESVNKFIIRNKLSSENIDLIGSHGQTIYHIPKNKKFFGFDTKSTMQIGDPSVICVKTGITTVGDFRVADVAAGGDGAPLVPYLDYILFSDNKKNRAFINIGGIANATYLKKSGVQNETIAFDTGPGNMLIDALTMKFFNKKYDKDGLISSKGKVDFKLFKFLSSHDKFYKKKFPKSTGREYYGEDFVNAILNFSKKIKPEDVIRTVTDFTAFTIYFNLRKFELDEIIISGGGARNISLMHYLKNYFGNIGVKEINEKGINADNKEAVLFAVLANELISGNKTNMTSVTGSSKNVYLGKICIA